jgi:hypothetical protein
MVIAADRTVFLAGYSFGGATDFDFGVVKVDTAGRIVWARRYGSPLGCEDRPWCLALDSAGAVIAAGGTIADFSKGWNYEFVRFGASGETSWVRRLDSPAHMDDKAAAIGLYPGGGFYLTGSSRKQPDSSRAPDWDILSCRCTAAGETVWTRRFDGSAHGDDFGTKLAVDEPGNCYVAGTTVAGRDSAGLVLLKYSPGGKLLWQRFVGRDRPGAVLSSGLVMDRTGRLYLVGAKHNPSSSFDYVVACFGRDGETLWSRFLDGMKNVDVPQAACVDAAGNLVVTGQSTGKGSSFDVLTAKYAPTGETLWTRRYNGPQNSADRGWCIATDQKDDVIVGATSIGPTGQPDMALLCYSPSGELVWTYRYSGGGTGEARPVVIRPYGDADILVAGYAMYPETGFDYLLLRISVPGF